MTAKTSGGEDLFLHDVQAHDAGSFARLEVALHRISHLLAEILHRVRLGEDGFSEGPSGKAALRRFFDHEDQFTHTGTIPNTGVDRKPDSAPNSMLPAPSSMLAALRKEAA